MSFPFDQQRTHLSNTKDFCSPQKCQKQLANGEEALKVSFRLFSPLSFFPNISLINLINTSISGRIWFWRPNSRSTTEEWNNLFSFSDQILGRGDVQPVSFSVSCNGCSSPIFGEQNYCLCHQNRLLKALQPFTLPFPYCIILYVCLQRRDCFLPVWGNKCLHGICCDFSSHFSSTVFRWELRLH